MSNMTPEKAAEQVAAMVHAIVASESIEDYRKVIREGLVHAWGQGHYAGYGEARYDDGADGDPDEDGSSFRNPYTTEED